MFLNLPSIAPLGLEEIINLHTQSAYANTDHIAWRAGISMAFHLVYYTTFRPTEWDASHLLTPVGWYLENETWSMGNLHGNMGSIIQVASSVSYI